MSEAFSHRFNFHRRPIGMSSIFIISCLLLNPSFIVSSHFADAFAFSSRPSHSTVSFPTSSRVPHKHLPIVMSTRINNPASIRTRSSTRATDKKITNGSRPPARIRASKAATVRVESPLPSSPNSITLDDYMKLPAAQYTCVPMPLNSSLQRVRGTKDRFRLDVPPMKLQSPGVPLVEVRPVVMATVSVEPEKERVIIRSDACQIGGSKIIDDLNINDFFEFSVEIRLTWDAVDAGGPLGTTGSKSGVIQAQSDIAVDLNPPGPFAFVPRQILEAVGNRAIALTLGSLQQNFMISLGKDFERWVTDDSYRMERQKLEDALGEEFMLHEYGSGSSRNGIPLDETLMAYLDR